MYFDLDVLDSEKAIRRHYAKLVREIRPEDDALRFSDLHDQYKAALVQLHFRQEYAEAEWIIDDDDLNEDGGNTFESVSVPIHIDAAEQTESGHTEGSYALDEEYEGRLIAVLGNPAQRSLPEFLNTDDALYDLSSRNFYGQITYQALMAHDPANLSHEQIATAEEFFGWGYLHDLHDRADVAKVFRNDRFFRAGHEVKNVRRTLRERNSWWNNLRLVIYPKRRFLLASWIADKFHLSSELPHSISRERIDFIERVGARRNLERWNFVGIGLPLLAFLVTYVSVIWAIGLKDSTSADLSPFKWVMLVGYCICLTIAAGYWCIQTLLSWIQPQFSPTVRIWIARIITTIGTVLLIALVLTGNLFALGILIYLLFSSGRRHRTS